MMFLAPLLKSEFAFIFIEILFKIGFGSFYHILDQICCQISSILVFEHNGQRNKVSKAATNFEDVFGCGNAH